MLVYIVIGIIFMFLIEFGIHSFEEELELNNDEKFRGVFIRAPAITDIGKAKPIAFCKDTVDTIWYPKDKYNCKAADPNEEAPMQQSS